MTREATASRWLHGPVADIALGCGVAYLLVFALFVAIGPRLEILVPAGLTPLISMTMGTPHYGATLRRVYADPATRRKYTFFAVWATALVWGCFVAGLYVIEVGSVFLTLYFTWSPWHYSGQNYGIALMFLRRREVTVSPLAKRALWTSFVASFLLASLAIHGETPSNEYVPASNKGSDYRLLSLGIPVLAIWLFASVYVLSAGVAVVALARRASLRDLAPTLLILLTQSMWFSVPFLVRYAGILEDVDALSREHAAYAFFWVASAHSVQYLWVTDYFERRGQPRRSHTGIYGRNLLAGAAIWGVPMLVFAPTALGAVPYDAGLFVMVAAAVNLHHFVLDGAIWKLRDGTIARILLRDGTGANGRTQGANRLAGRGVLGIGAVVAALQVIGHVDGDIVAPRALREGDAQAYGAALERLDLVGRSSARMRMEAALLKLSLGDGDGAALEARTALDLHRNYETVHNLAVYLQRSGSGIEAIAATREALDLYEAVHDRRPAQLEHDLAWMLVTYRGDDPDAIAEAERLAARVIQVDPQARFVFTHALILDALGRTEEALIEAGEALRRARTDGDRVLDDQIRRRFPRLHLSGEAPAG